MAYFGTAAARCGIMDKLIRFGGGKTGMAVFWEQLLALVAVIFIAFGTVYGYRSWRRNKMR